MQTEFIHLHVHTIHSHLDSTITIQSLINQAVAFNMPGVAITDYANLDGADKFMRKCYEVGIKPIVGCEMYVVDDVSASFSLNPAYHLLLLCKSRKGLENLKQLVAFANNEGFHHKPRIDKKLLKAHAEGLIALSACIKGEIPYLCLRSQYNEAVNAAKEYAAIFPGDFYIELQENSLPEQKIVNQSLLKIAAELNIPIVATNDCHYLTPDDAIEHEKLMCEQTGKSMPDPTHMRYSANEFYFKSPQEMTSAFAYAPEAISNACAIAENCDVVRC
jgi:DNA polymerase-3 subunit alpha